MQTVTEFIIDLSGSMKDKIAFTKQILLSDIVPALDFSFKIGIKSFSAVQGQQPVIQELPLGIIDKQSIIKAITNLTAKDGGTPISEAIRQSVITLKEYSANKKKIILVTDGEEDKGGNYVEECKKAKSEGINCEIHIIGLGLNQQAQVKAQEISSLTNGTFSNISFSAKSTYNQSVIKNNLSTFYNAINKSRVIPLTRTIETKTPVKIVKEINKEIIKGENAKLMTADDSEILENPLINKIKEDKLENVSETTTAILKTIIQEIKEIKDEIKALKSNKDNIQEITEDAEFNEKIRSISEKYLFDILKGKYPNRVKWLNEDGESGLNHDFEILEEDGGIEYYIECKGTAKKKTTFFVTKNEWNLFLNNTKNYRRVGRLPCGSFPL